MKIELPSDLQQYIDDQVKAGHFRSRDAMIRAALTLMMDHQAELNSARAAIDESRQQFRQGQGVPASELTLDRIRAGAIKRFGPPKRRKAS